MMHMQNRKYAFLSKFRISINWFVIIPVIHGLKMTLSLEQLLAKENLEEYILLVRKRRNLWWL